MAQIRLDLLRRQQAQTDLPTSSISTAALAAPGQAVQDIGRELGRASAVLAKVAENEQDNAVAKSLSEFGFESEFIRSAAEAEETQSTAGFQQRVTQRYDEAMAAHLGGIEDPRTKRAVERRLLSARQSFISDAARVETGFYLREAEVERNSRGTEALAGFDYTGRLLDHATSGRAAQPGFAEFVAEDYQASVDEYVASIPDARVRREVRDNLLARTPTVAAKAAETEFTAATGLKAQATNDALASLDNRVRSAPDDYPTALNDGFALIDGLTGYGPAEKAGMRRALREDLAASRFEGLTASATTSDAFDGIETQLRDDYWREQFSPEAYDRALDQVDTQRRQVLEGRQSYLRTVMTAAAERSDAGYAIPEDELQGLFREAGASRDSNLVARAQKIAIQQEVIRTKGASRPADLRAEATRVAAKRDEASPLSERIIAAESGGDPSARNPNSSAGGLGQFTDATWVRVVRRNRPDLADGRSDAELVALKTGEGTAGLQREMIDAHVKELRAGLTRAGVAADDGAVYLAWFAGQDAATRLLRARPDQKVSEILSPAAIEANAGMRLGDKSFADWTTEDMIQWAASKMGGERGGTSYTAFLRAEALETLAGRIETEMKRDPAALAQNTGFLAKARLGELAALDSPEAFGERAKQMQAWFDYQNVPVEDWKPLTAQEAQQLGARMSTATPEEQLEVASQFAAMGERMGRAALAQVSLAAPVFAYAGGLAMEGQSDAASAILRGNRRMRDDKAYSPEALAPGGGIALFQTEVNNYIGEAGIALAPEAMATVRQAAMAHYVETRALENRAFSGSAFRESLRAVLGTEVASVNGRKTILPTGVDEATLGTYLSRLDETDLATLSVLGGVPRYADGSLVDIEDFRDDAQLVAIGGNQYRVLVDGQPLITAVDAQGRAANYIIRLDPAQVRGGAL